MMRLVDYSSSEDEGLEEQTSETLSRFAKLPELPSSFHDLYSGMSIRN
jgi:hypothetical protein